MMSETIWRSIGDFKWRKLSLVWQVIVHLDPLSVKSFSWVISKFEMSLSEYLKTRLEYAAMPMQFQAPGSAVAQFDSWDFNLKTATIFSSSLNQRLHRRASNSVLVALDLNVRWKLAGAAFEESTFLKVRAFPRGSPAAKTGLEAFQKCVHLVFQNLLLSVNSKLTSRSQCEAFLQLESDPSRAFRCMRHLPNMCISLIVAANTLDS